MAEHNNKVLWSEGLFLRPQHFQQQERYVEHLLDHRIQSISPYGFGFAEVQVDLEMLKHGKLAISSASGVMPDGTPISIPVDANIPESLEIPPDCKNAVVGLALPFRRAGMPEMSYNSPKELPMRYHGVECKARNSLVEHEGIAELKVGRLGFRIQLLSEVTPAYGAIGFAKIAERRPDGQVLLDNEYIPPCMDSHASPILNNYLREICGLLKHRAQVLASRVSQPGSKGVSDVSDFMLLQVCNRYDPLISHLSSVAPLHPELLYRYLLELAGELATFGRKERCSIEFKPYQHDDLASAFRPVVAEIRRTLTAVMEQTALPLPLVDRGRGVYVGEIRDAGLIQDSTFVLAAYADIPAEQLRNSIPLQIKIGSVEKIRDLVMSHLPGIEVQPLPVAPRQIPYHAGYTYFVLDRNSEHWKDIKVSRVLAMHLAGEFPGITLEMWAIRE
jgi:type VI secretion system protein ImpJ